MAGCIAATLTAASAARATARICCTSTATRPAVTKTGAMAWGGRYGRPTAAAPSRQRNGPHTGNALSRQVGNATQSASVTLRLEPHDSAEAIVVENKLKPGALPAALMSLVEQSVEEATNAGGLYGNPLMRLKVTIVDVGYKESESSEVSLTAAASKAVSDGLQQAGCVLLEPVMKLEVVTPEEFIGNVQADLNSRRASIVRSENRGRLWVIEAEVALAKMFGYATQVRGISQGRASYSMEPLKFAEAQPDVLESMR